MGIVLVPKKGKENGRKMITLPEKILVYSLRSTSAFNLISTSLLMSFGNAKIIQIITTVLYGYNLYSLRYVLIKLSDRAQ